MLNINAQTLNAILQVEKENENQFLKNGSVELPILNTKLSVNGSINKSNLKIAEFELLGKHGLQGEWLEYSRSLTTQDGTFTINHGKFRVITQEYKEETNKTHLECWDMMANTQKEVKDGDIQITFPTTTKLLFNEVARVCGLTVLSDTQMPSNDVVARNEWVGTSNTYRTILDHIAEVSGLTIQIKQDKLAIDSGDVTNIELSARRSKKITVGEMVGKFNILNITQEPQHYNTPYPDNWNTIPIDDRVEWVIQNNPILNSDRDGYKAKVFNRIKDIEYREFFNDSFGFGIFDVGDKVTVKDNDGIIHNSVITQEISEFKQSLHSKIYSERPKNAVSEYVIDTDQRREGQEVYILVDQANGKIEQVINQIGDRTDKTTSITQDIDNIELKISNFAVEDNLIPNLNALSMFDDGFYPYWKFKVQALYPQTRLFPSKLLNPFSSISPNFKIVDEPMALSGKAKEYWRKGTAFSSEAYIVPNSVYSYAMTRTSGNTPLTVVIVEKNKDKQEHKRTPFILSGQSSRETLTFTPAQMTMYVSLEFVTNSNAIFKICDEMFTRGNPSTYKKDPDDILIYAQTRFTMTDREIELLGEAVEGLEGNLSQVSIRMNAMDANIDINATKIDNINNDIHNAGVEINAVEGVGIYGKKFKVMNEQRDKTVFEVVTVDGQEQVNMVGSIQSEGGEIEFDSKNRTIKIGTSKLINSTETGFIGISGVGLKIGEGFNQTGTVRGIQLINEDTNQFRMFVTQNSSGLVTTNTDIIRPSTTATTKFIGGESTRYRDIYLENQPNVSSDIRGKYNISKIDDLLLDEFEKVEEKFFITKHDDMFSFGYIAQDVERALYKFCLNVYGWDHANDWLKKFKLLNKSESYMSLLYNEVQIIKQAVKHRKIDRANDRIEQLESQIEESVKQHDDLRREFDTLIGILKEGGHI